MYDKNAQEIEELHSLANEVLEKADKIVVDYFLTKKEYDEMTKLIKRVKEIREMDEIDSFEYGDAIEELRVIVVECEEVLKKRHEEYDAKDLTKDQQEETVTTTNTTNTTTTKKSVSRGGGGGGGGTVQGMTGNKENMMSPLVENPLIGAVEQVGQQQVGAQIVTDNYVTTNEVVEVKGIEGEGYYVDKLGNVVKDKWLNQGNSWQYIGSDGKKEEGWFKDTTNRWYYSQNDNIETGLIQVNSGIYYMGIDGAMKEGYQMIGNNIYYFNMIDGYLGKPQGAMIINNQTPEGFIVGPDGAIIK